MFDFTKPELFSKERCWDTADWESPQTEMSSDTLLEDSPRQFRILIRVGFANTANLFMFYILAVTNILSSLILRLRYNRDMKRLLISCLIISALAFPQRVSATSNPLERPNNHFGVHILSEHDLDTAAEMINGNGGAWGYVTLVIREDERHLGRWNQVFRNMQKLKLIPIVRIATSNQNGVWKKPDIDQADDWALFLSQLPWPTQNRYVILFNEPNHAKEWGGEINPEEYAQIARKYWEQLKRASADFYVLPAALDLSAPNSDLTIEASIFWEKMHKADNLIFTIFDGWNSHSYPNPGFCGDPNDTGKTSIRGFEWETRHLSQYHLLSNLPIFITETGWGCQLPEQELVQFYKTAFEKIWQNPKIAAITPFILSYNQHPFENFSWIDKNGNKKAQYKLVSNLEKTKGRPLLAGE